MKRQRFVHALAAVALAFVFQTGAQAAPKVDPQLNSRLAAAKPTDLFGVVLTFKGERVTDAEVAQVLSLGVGGGYRMNSLPIVAVNATPAQITQMTGWDSLRSIYLNAPVQLYDHQTNPLIGVDRLRTDASITRANGGLPVSGKGITIAVDDTGVDGTHQDLTYNATNPATGKTIQNVIMNMNDKDGLVVRSNTLGNVFNGIIPATYAENQPNSDTNGGHGTHVASIAAGTGTASGGLYAGVAPGASVVGIGSGAVLFVLGQVAALDYCLTNQFVYNIRVVNNSWGNSATNYDPDHPVNVATKALHDNGIVVVFANGNDGPDPNSQNRWAVWPWVITAGASTKDGRLASFSSRGIFGDAVVHPTILTPGTGGPADKGYTSDVIAARAKTNLTENGLNADTQIPTAFLPFYTQISGTSMAAPHLSGVVANVLEANRSLVPDDVRDIITRTATPLATYDEFEVGAGLANVHAAVDLAQNPSKPYGNFGFTGKGLALARQDAPAITGSISTGGAQTHQINVPSNARFAFIQLDWGAAAGEDEVIVDNTNLVANDLSLSVQHDGQTVASSDDLNLVGLFGAREGVKLEFPEAGAYTLTVDANFGLGSPASQPYKITVTYYTFDPAQVADASALDPETRLEIYRLVYDRVMSADGGAFRPDDVLTRIELGRALMLGARVPQYIPNQPSFTDITPGTPESLFAESLKREGVMGTTGTTFGPAAQVNRLEQAVALVRALRLDKDARALANTTVTASASDGTRQPLTDNADIPASLRGYVQLALDHGLMQAFPAEIKQTGPGQFVAVPGPRFEPATLVKRSALTNTNQKVIYYLNLTAGAVQDDFGHGTHVSGIAAGYLAAAPGPDGVPLTADDINIHGVAPQARLMGYKVLATVGSGASASIIAAIEDAVQPFTIAGYPKPVAHVINLSLGDTTNDPDGATAVACDNATLAGTTVVAAAGNSGAPTPGNPSGEGTLGSPGTGRRVITAGAALDPGAAPYKLDELGGEMRTGMKAFPMDGSPGISADITNNYVDCGLAETPDQVPDSVSGHIALIARGSTVNTPAASPVQAGTGLFSNKAAFATAKGAVAVVFYNNVPGELTATTVRKAIIPVVGISQENGQHLKDAIGSTAVGAVSQYQIRLNKGVIFEPSMADFSSKGPVGGYGMVKPDVVAPGVNILSATVRVGGAETNTATMFDPPLRFVITSVQSNSGRVSVANADNNGAGTSTSPASFDYSNAFGYDFAPSEVSASKHLKFNNPASEMFQFTAVVYANLPDPAYAQSSSSTGTSSSSPTGTSSGGSTGTQTGTTGGLTLPATQTKALTFTVNPLTGTVKLVQ